MVNKDKGPAIKKTPPAQLDRAEGYKTLYVNATKLALSAWDIRMTLGQIVEREPDKYISEDQLTVLMAPGQAKAFWLALDSTIQKYEKMYGEITLPKEAFKTL